jgi:hypothetical protein
MSNAGSEILPSEVYQRSNKALETLSELWNTSTDVIKAIADVTASSLRSEPDYQALQEIKKKHDKVLESLKSELKWIEQNHSKLNSPDSVDDEKQSRIKALEQEQQELSTV